MNRKIGLQRRAKKHVKEILESNDLLNETTIRLISKSNMNALLTCETDISASIIVEGIKDDLDEKYKILAISKYHFVILEK